MDGRGEVEHEMDRPIHDDGIDPDVLDRQAPGSGGGPNALGIARLDRCLDGFLGLDDGQQVPAGRIEDRGKARVRGRWDVSRYRGFGRPGAVAAGADERQGRDKQEKPTEPAPRRWAGHARPTCGSAAA